MALMALMAPKRAQEERNALHASSTWYTPLSSAGHECSFASAVEQSTSPAAFDDAFSRLDVDFSESSRKSIQVMVAGLNQCRATIGNRSRLVLSMSGKTRHKRSPDRLLLISCSNRKRVGYNLMPAIDRYDGPAFYVLRRYLRETDDRQLRVYILSAEFGIINVRKLIPYYDRLMTRSRARELREHTTRALRSILQKTCYTELFICAGAVYEGAIDIPYLEQVVSVKVAARGQGPKLSSLHSWLRQKSP